MTDERRRQARYGALFDVRFALAADAARALNAWSVNFSSGGLCVRSKSAFGVGEVVALSLTIEGEQFDLEGVVAWVRGEAVGVRFVNVRPAVRERLEVVARSLSDSLPEIT